MSDGPTMTWRSELPMAALWLDKGALQSLFDAILQAGYEIIGPTIRQAAIVYEPITKVEELPRGWTDRQGPGMYRLERREDEALFGYVVGPHSWKRYLFPPVATVLKADRTDDGWQMQTYQPPTPKYAFLGVRACELAAIAVQDRVFLEGAYRDPIYAARREQALILAVNCTQAASTCFCTSLQTGPRCTAGFDLALTELDDGVFIEVGSDRGRNIVDGLPLRPATRAELVAAEEARQRAVDDISRRLDTRELRQDLMQSLHHPRWQEVAQRCLSCANCTMVCPTCFCSGVEDVSDLDQSHAERRRHWDSCFNFDFSYQNGGVVRNQIAQRYRQWLTHKLATWHDQFGQSGCVGCGRCITWCPVGIDLIEEVAALREQP